MPRYEVQTRIGDKFENVWHDEDDYGASVRTTFGTIEEAQHELDWHINEFEQSTGETLHPFNDFQIVEVSDE